MTERLRFTRIEATLRRATDAAALLRVAGDREVWVPLSCLAIRSARMVEGAQPDDALTLHVMDWKARELDLTEAPRPATLPLEI